MAPTGIDGNWQRFLVEHYRPGLSPDDLRNLALRVRSAAIVLAGEGVSVRYREATILPADESLLCQFDAVSEEAVRAAYERAGLDFERISPALAGPGIARFRRSTGHQEALE